MACLARSVDSDSTNPGIFYIPVTRADIDKANAEAELCDYLKEQFPSVSTLKDLYRAGYKLAWKIDTLNINKDRTEADLIIISDESYKLAKKQLRKNLLQEFWDKSKVPISFIAGAVLSAIITFQTVSTL